MFKKILLPFDLTTKHQPVFDIAVEMVGKSGGEIVLLHVIEAIAGWPDGEVQEFYQRIEKKAQEHLQNYGDKLDEKKIPWHSKVTTGSRAEEVAQFAAEIEADLILVSAPRFNPQAPAGNWASLSWKISVLSSCPVLLVK